MKTKFDKIYVMSLIDEVYRQNRITQILNQFNIEFEFIYTIPLGNFWVDFPYGDYDENCRPIIRYNGGHSLSNFLGCYMAIKLAIKNNANNVLIIEDDVCLHKDINLIEQYLNKVPEDADIVRYGYNTGRDQNEFENYDINNLFFKDNQTWSNRYMGSQMWALMNKRTMETAYKSIEMTITGGDSIYNIFVNNEHNFNIYYAITNIALDQYAYQGLKNNQPLRPGYIPFGYKYIQQNIDNYYEP